MKGQYPPSDALLGAYSVLKAL